MKNLFTLLMSTIIVSSIIAKDIHVPKDYQKIQDAINAAKDDDRILIASGNYSEYLQINKSISLIGTSPCTLYAGSSPIKSVRNKKALINMADNIVVIKNMTLIGVGMNNGKSKTASPISMYNQVAIDSKDAMLELKSVNFKGFTRSYVLMDGGTFDLTGSVLNPPSSIHPTPIVGFVLDDVGGVTLKEVVSKNTGMEYLFAINEIYSGSRESFIIVKESNIQNTKMDKGRAGSYTLYGKITVPEVIKPVINSPIVNIPDANFKKYLVGEKHINTNGDKEIQVSEAKEFSGKIECGFMYITSLKGIEAFTSLTELACSFNALNVLDISKNINLTSLYCINCKLSELDVSNNIKLLELWVNENSLEELNVQNNETLTFLNCGANKLSKLDITNNLKLTAAIFSFNNLTSINLDKNKALKYLEMANNNFKSVNISNNKNLVQFSCAFNEISSLNLSSFPSLTDLDVRNNNLSYLNLKNLSPEKFSYPFFNIKGNPKLKCVLVDDVEEANKKWSYGIDETIIFNTSCKESEIVNEIGNVEEQVKPTSVGGLVSVPVEDETEIKEESSNIKFNGDKVLFTTTVEKKPYEFTLPSKLQYQSHKVSSGTLLITYKLIKTGENYIGIWDDKLNYKAEFKLNKLSALDYEFNKENKITLVYYKDPEHKTKFAGVFDSEMKYVGQFELTGTTDVDISFEEGNPILIYSYKGQKWRIILDRNGKEIARLKV